MPVEEQYYNVFTSEGKILPVEYGLEAVNGSTPVVVLKTRKTIVCASKKRLRDKLEEGKNTVFCQISRKVYMAITGLQADTDQIVYEAKSLAHDLSFDFGYDITADILCRNFADKKQKLIQRNGERAYAFSAAFFGFDNQMPIIYHTDISAVLYPYYALAVGENQNKMTKYLEKNYTENCEDRVACEIAAGALLESIGTDSEYSEIEIACLRKGESLHFLNDLDIDLILQSIAEK